MEYLSPGVYVEEVDAGPRPIEGVSTSTAGFIGVTVRGSEEPQFITSYPAFVREYGGPLSPTIELLDGGDPVGQMGHLSRAVRGVFENGGQRLFIQRVLASDSETARFQVGNGIATRLTAAPASPNVAEVASVYGFIPGQTVDFQVDGAATFSRRVATIDAERRRVSFDTPSPAGTSLLGLDPEGTAIVVSPAAGAGVAVTLEARARGDRGNAIRVSVASEYSARTRLVAAFSVPLQVPATSLSIDAITNDALGRRVLVAVTVDSGTIPGQGDVLEFAQGRTLARRTLSSVSASQLALDEPLAVTFTADSTVRVVTVLRVAESATPVSATVFVPEEFVSPAAARRIEAGDALILSAAGQPSVEVQVPATWTPAGDGTLEVRFASAPPPGWTFVEGALLTHSELAARANTDTLTVASARQFYPGAFIQLSRRAASGEEVLREYRRIDAISGRQLVLEATTSNDFHVDDFISLCEHTVVVSYINEQDGVREEEVFRGLSLDSDAERFIQSVVNRRSKLVTVASVTTPSDADKPPGFSTPKALPDNFGGGDNGLLLTPFDFVGEDLGPGKRTGLQAFNQVDEVNIVSAPGIWSQTVQNALITHCEVLADRFAVLDTPLGASILEAQDHRNLYDSRYAALYYPWLALGSPAGRILAPPSGHIVGIYARTDVERGVWKAPANVVVRGIVGLEQAITKREQDILNPEPNNLNVIRDFRAQGRGVRVWGARCITSDSPWKYIPVRRLFLFLEESIENGTQWAVFEPNDRRLWARLSQSVTAFLTAQWRNGALMGSKPDEAFFVVCDRRTMTQDDIENGRLIMRIGVAPVRPAEFVIIRISQWDGGSSVDEFLSA